MSMPHSEQVGAPSNMGRGPALADGGSSFAGATAAGGIAGVAATLAAGKAVSPLCVR